MSNDPTFLGSVSGSPGDIGLDSPAKGKFTQVDAVPAPSNPYGVRILVSDPSTAPSPQGALKVDVDSTSYAHPALNIDNRGTGPDIRLSANVTISESSGELVFEDSVAGSVPLSSVGGTASNVNVAGVGVFKQKLGGNFEFRGINTKSSRLVVELDATNNEIDLDVDQTALVITSAQVSNFGSAVASNSAVAANTAKVSADGSVATHADVTLAGIVEGDILSLQGGSLSPLALTASNVDFDDGTASLGATDVQAAIVALDGKVDTLQASGGEANTASNVNTAGVGVFESKGGVNLRFRGVEAASSKVSVSLNATDKTIEVDVVENQLAITASQVSDFSTAFSNEVSTDPTIAANTAKVSADGPVSTHSDVNTTGAVTDQILSINGSGVWVPKTLSAQNVGFDESGVSFLSDDTQQAIEALDALVAVNTAKVSADGPVSTHSDVNTTGATTDQILSINGSGVWVPKTLSSQNVSFDDAGVSFSATDVKSAVEQLDTISALNTAKVSADGSVDTHSDVDTTSVLPSVGEHLTWNGSNWVPGESGNVSVASTPVVDNRITRFDGTTGKSIQQSLLSIDDLGNLTFVGANTAINSSGDFSVTPTGSFTLKAGAGESSFLLHADGSTAIEISPTAGGSIVLRDLVRSATGEDITISAGKDHNLTPTERLITQAGAGFETQVRHGDGANAFRVTPDATSAGSGMIVNAPRLYPGAAGKELGQISGIGRQWGLVASEYFTGGANFDSILRAQAGRQARMESADLVARVEVEGDTGDITLNGPTFMNDIFSLFAGVPESSVPAEAGKYHVFVDTDTSELSLRKPTGQLISLEGSGSAVTGPSFGTATDNALARFDTTDGNIIQNSAVLLTDGPNAVLGPATSENADLGTDAVPFRRVSQTQLVVRDPAATSSDIAELRYTHGGTVSTNVLTDPNPTPSGFGAGYGSFSLGSFSNPVGNVVGFGAGFENVFVGDSFTSDGVFLRYSVTQPDSLEVDGNFAPADAVSGPFVLGHPTATGGRWGNAYLQKSAFEEGLSVPSAEPGHTLLYVDPTSGALNARHGDGTIVSLEETGVDLTRGQVIANQNIAEGTTVTSTNTTVLPNSNGLQPYANASEFVSKIYVYLNGQLLVAGESLSDNPDVYPAGNAAAGEFAMTRDITNGDVIQVLKFG